jgi:hypothetical protein
VIRRSGAGAEGEVSPPDPARAAELRTAFRQAVDEFRGNSRFAYGWRGGTAFDIPPYPVPGNVMDAFDDAVDELDRAWAPRSAEAAREVRLTLDGRPVQIGEAGRFSLGPEACNGELEAVDGSEGRTAILLQGCTATTPFTPPVIGGSCLPKRLTVARRRLGPIRLGRPLSAALRRNSRPARPGVRVLCVRGGGRVRVLVGRGGRVELVLSTGSSHRVRRIGPGLRVRALRRSEPARRPLGRGFILGSAGRLYGVRARRVVSVGRAQGALARRPAALRRALRRF